MLVSTYPISKFKKVNIYITKIFITGSISNGNLGRIVNSAKVSFISLTALDQSATLEFQLRFRFEDLTFLTRYFGIHMYFLLYKNNETIHQFLVMDIRVKNVNVMEKAVNLA